MEKRENFSRKRMAILEALQGTTVHPTADWVFSQLKPKYPDLSLGTVYRNLKKFCETGKAASVGVINGQEHFDGNTAPPCPPGLLPLRRRGGRIPGLLHPAGAGRPVPAAVLCRPGCQGDFRGPLPQCLAQQDAGKISEKPIQH